MSDKSKVLKNANFLLIRTVINIFLAFFTTKLILKYLGVIDFGVFNVIAGSIALLGFFSSSLTSSIQRHFSVELANSRSDKLNFYYNSSIRIHILFSLVLVLVGYCISNLIVDNVLNIPLTLVEPAKVVFIITLLIFAFNIINVPNLALINANEDMNITATISLFEGFLKLLGAIILMYFNSARLEIYSLILLIITILVTIVYFIVVYNKYKNVRFQFIKIEPYYYKSLSSFAGWTIFGSFGSLARGQGLNIIINIFNGAKMNAAYGIASQIGGQIQSFSSIIIKPFEPQIVKLYTAKLYDKVYDHVILSTRYSSYVFFLLVLPFVIATDFILKLWLGSYPDYTKEIILFNVVNLYFTIVSLPLITIIQSTGSIRMFQLFNGGLFILNIPISYYTQYFGAPLYIIFVTLIIITIIGNLVKLYFVTKCMSFPVYNWLIVTLVKPLYFLLPILLIYLFITPSNYMSNQLLIIFLFECLLMLLILIFGFSKNERNRVKQLIKSRL